MSSERPAYLRLKAIVKEFPGVRALDSAELDVMRGEIHGLVGENGAGKSTLIKVLAGVYQAEAGEIEIDGKGYPSLTPRAAHEAGLRFIHQELQFIEHFTVAETVFLGQEITAASGLRKRQMEEQAQAFFAEQLGLAIAPRKLIRDLSVAERKMVQIARGLIDGRAKIVVFDEPTAPLDEAGKAVLFHALRSLRDRGVTILYVSHYLQEITELCDRVTVLRQGQRVAEFEEVSARQTDEIIAAMLGQELGHLYPVRKCKPGAVAIETQQLSRPGAFENINISVKAGEVVGIAGIAGSGRNELVDAIYGRVAVSSGRVLIHGQPQRSAKPHQSVKAGLGLVPRDRRSDGLVLDMTVSDNITLSSLEKVATAGIFLPKRALQTVRQLMQRLDIRPRNPQATARNLSGGNQQKTVLARWFAAGTSAFILDNPTVGVDLGARREIYKEIVGLTEEGAAVLLSSEDPAELLGLSDRILVLMRGRLVGEFPARELTLDRLVALTTSGAENAHG